MTPIKNLIFNSNNNKCNKLFSEICNFFVQRLPKSAKKGNEEGDGPLVSKLLKLILTKTDKDFQFFCEALRRSGQGHIVDVLLTEKGIFR